MARPRKDGNTTIEDQITKQEDAVAKAKAKYDAEVVKLNICAPATSVGKE